MRSTDGCVLSPTTTALCTGSYGGWSSVAAMSPRHRVARVQARSVLPSACDAASLRSAASGRARLGGVGDAAGRHATQRRLGDVVRDLVRPPHDDGGVGQQQRDDEGVQVVLELAGRAQHDHLAGARVAAEPDLGVEVGLAVVGRRSRSR